jgi:hypothetical protein
MLFSEDKQEIQLGAVGQEGFCQAVAAGFDYPAAYRRVYKVPNNIQTQTAAFRLARAPHIMARIMQLRAEGIKGFVVKREDLLEPMLWALNTSRDRGNAGEVRKSIETIGKLFGLVIDKMEAEVMHKFQVMKDVTVSGDNLVFDIGSGEPVVIHGQRVDGEPPARNAEITQVNEPQTTLDTLRVAGGTDPLAALQNASTELPAQSVMLNAESIPVEARLDVASAVKKARGGGIPRKQQHSGERLVRRRADNEAETEVAACGEEML